MTEVQRQFQYIKSGPETLFAWLHQSTSDRAVKRAAVICNPLGVEYMSGHRSIRRLADRLAESGIPALRFDYTCTGDSSGGQFQNATVAQVVGDIHSAVAAVRSQTGASCVVLIGVGLGATFAALAAETADIGQLVLWNPTTSGRRFVREQRLLSQVLDEGANTNDAAIDSAGIFLSAELQKQIGEIDLTKLRWERNGPVLLISRNDMDSHRKLAATLSEKAFVFEHATLPGYREMMDQPTDTVVPAAAIEFIRAWIEDNGASQPDGVRPEVDANSAEKVSRLGQDDVATIELDEIPAWFGKHDHLFGIATQPAEMSAMSRTKCAFVFLNCGSEHHAGPHRLYTLLCRHLASNGALTFRFDIEGIGDSVSIGNNEENNAYSPVALDDIDAALNYLSREYGCEAFIVSGICAGAYHSFKAATELKHHNILEANLVNPLVFEWNYDDPEDHLRYEVHTYRSAIRDRGSWRRLLSGDIDYRRLLRSVFRHISENIRRQLNRLSHAVVRRAPKGLPTDLRTLQDLQRPLTLILSEGDPGLKIMRLQAGLETAAALRAGRITTYDLQKSNHGLSKKYMQDQLVATLVGKYYGAEDAGLQACESGQ